MMKLHITVLTFLLLTNIVHAQRTVKKSIQPTKISQIKNLKVGDRIPDILIPKIMNNVRRSERTSTFKDQLLILDFWATTCPGCIEALPKMAELQNKFGDKIVILPVTYETENLASTFWKKNRFTKDLKLPSVVEDNLLKKMFKHYFIPHEVWIYKGFVIGITYPEYVNEQNIQLVLDGRKNDWPIKNDFLPVVDSHKPLFNFTPASLVQQNNIKYTAVTGYIEGAKTVIYGLKYDSLNRTRRNYIVNFSILDAYAFGWRRINPDLPLPEPNQVIFEVKDPSKYMYHPKWGYYEDFKRKHFICYESVRPDSGENEAEQTKMIISDMDYLLNLKGRWEKRKAKCLILIRTDSIDRLKSVSKEEFISTDKYLTKFRRRPLSLVTWLLNKEVSNPRAFNESGYKGLVDMDLEITSWSDIESIRKALKLYGLDLREEIRDLDFFVFTEQPK